MVLITRSLCGDRVLKGRDLSPCGKLLSAMDWGVEDRQFQGFREILFREILFMEIHMMNFVTRMVCFGIAFACLASCVCVLADVPAKQVPLKTETQLGIEKETEAAQKVRPKEELQIERLSLPEDATPCFDVKEFRINGNTLISTEQLLKDLPLVYNDSEKTLEDAKSGDLYDLRVIHDIIARPGQAHRVSTRAMNGLTKYILRIYNERGHRGIYVYVPAQAVRDGAQPVLKDDVLVIEVLEAKVSDIGTTYHRYDPNSLERIPYRDLKEGQKPILSESLLLDWSPVKVGQVANQKQLDDFINLLNLNPDRYISEIISRGKTSDTLSLGYDIYERSPWHFSIQADNSGSKEWRWSPRINIINTNLTGRDDRLWATYKGPLDSHPVDPFIKNYSVFASYEFPVFTPRLRLKLLAGHTNFDVFEDFAGGIDFLGSCDYHGGDLRFNVFQAGGWFFDVTGELKHVKSRTSLSLGIEAEVEMDLWGAGFDIHRSDDKSTTSFRFNRVESFGGSSEEDFHNYRTDSDPDFTIYTFKARHSQYLDPKKKIQRISGSLEIINPTERLASVIMRPFGGLSVRGYDENEIVADGGILVSAQYEYDLVKHFEDKQKPLETESNGRQAEKPWFTKLALLTFTDFGRAKIKHHVAGEKKVQELSSVGLGIAATVGDNFDAQIYYGYPLRSTDDTDVGKGRWNFNLVYRF
jgi:hemolysin activation/secretion protein